MARKTYNDEFKIAAAKLVREQGYTVRKAAQSLGVDQDRSATGWRSSPRRRSRPRPPPPRTPICARRSNGSAPRTSGC